MNEIHEESYEFGGKKLAYLRYGEWSDTVVLFFHGFWGGAGYLPKDAGRDICVISFDRPGIGRSDFIGSYTMEELFARINECLKSHGVRSVHVMGHSAGGYYAQVYAMLHKDFTKTLTLLSSLPPMHSSKYEHLLDKSMRNRRFLTLYAKPITMIYFYTTAKASRDQAEQIARTHIGKMSPSEQIFMRDNFDMYTSIIRGSGANSGKGAFSDACAMYAKREDIDINVPVFVWNGTNDAPTTPAIGRALADSFSAKKFHLIEGGTHHQYLVHWHEAVGEAISFTGDQA